MTPRLLAVIPEGEEAAPLTGMTAVAAVARAERARVWLAYFHRIPPARLDHHGRVAVSTDTEMARIAGLTAETLRLATRAFDDLDIETVVRFGSPPRELTLELEAFTPTLVALFAPRDAGPVARWRMRTLRHRVTSRAGVRVLAVATDWSRWSVPSQTHPAVSWQDVVVGGPYD